MVDDRPEDNGPLGDSGRPKREPPTIELEATEVSSETPKAESGAQADQEPSGPSPAPASEPSSRPVSKPVSPWAIAPISGAVAASLVIAVGWVLFGGGLLDFHMFKLTGGKIQFINAVVGPSATAWGWPDDPKP